MNVPGEVIRSDQPEGRRSVTEIARERGKMRKMREKKSNATRSGTARYQK